MTVEVKIPVSTYVSLTIIAGAAAYGTYQLGKLGVDWVKEGITTIKEKKESSK